jgi:hypothetical protein
MGASIERRIGRGLCDGGAKDRGGSRRLWGR